MNRGTFDVKIKLCEFKKTVDVSCNGEIRSYGFSYLENTPRYMNYNNLSACEKSSNLAAAYWLGCINDEGDYIDTNEFRVWDH